MKNIVYLYTDGACSGNSAVSGKPSQGGWGCVLKYGCNEKSISGYNPDTTNNRMELTAVIEGLKALNKPCNVKIVTDSRYVQQGINEWLDSWIARGWKTANHTPVKNADLWEELKLQIDRHINIDVEWVKGHSGHPYNEMADKLATNAVKNKRGV